MRDLRHGDHIMLGGLEYVVKPKGRAHTVSPNIDNCDDRLCKECKYDRKFHCFLLCYKDFMSLAELTKWVKSKKLVETTKEALHKKANKGTFFN